jgi:hypothetical protein
MTDTDHVMPSGLWQFDKQVTVVLADMPQRSIGCVDVGNINNAADSSGFGSVAYNYRIAQNETTICQYTEFLNAAAMSDPYALYRTNLSNSGGYSYIAGIRRKR